MLDEKRIKEAEKNVAVYLRDGLVRKIDTTNESIKNTYERNYKESLNAATKLFESNTSNLWVIVCSYYSMFYIANAVLYKNNYKIGSKIPHKVTTESLIVFVRNKLKKSLLEEYEKAEAEALELTGRKTDEIIESFGNELEKRSFFQYESTEDIKRAKAETSLERAKKFIFEMRKLL